MQIYTKNRAVPELLGPFLSCKVIWATLGFPKNPKYLYGGVTFPNHNSNSDYRNPTFYYAGTSDPLGLGSGGGGGVDQSCTRTWC